MIQCKPNQNLEEQFDDLRFDQRLRIIALAVNGEMEKRFGVSLRISCIHRTREEQTSIYGVFKPSPHFDWRALDFSRWAIDNTTGKIVELKEEHFKYIDEWVDKHFPYDMADVQRIESSVVHEIKNKITGVSAGRHIHLQVTFRSQYTRILK